MTLKFISGDSLPNYLATSSDVVDGKIDGCCLVGATVFLTDSYCWYIIKEDLVLEPYCLPVSFSGGIIGTVNQGNAGIVSWPITIDPLFARLRLSYTKYALVVGDDSHFHVHDGTLWSASYVNTGVNSLGTIIIGCETGARKTHTKISHTSIASAKVEFFNGCLFTNGTAIDIINHNLSIFPSVGNPDISLVLNPNISVEGNIFRSILIPGGGTGGNKTGGGSPFSDEFIVPENTQLYMKYTNLDGNNAMYGVELTFYEE